MRSRREVVRNQKIALCFALFLILSVLVFSCVFSFIRSQAASAKKTYKYYKSIQIRSGDTLWDIADQYMTDEYDSMKAYIEEVCAINHISGDRIHAGEYITIPYYSSRDSE